MASRQKMESPALPDELTTEIFLRLPVKSLLRFTLGCREWNTIIKSPSFVHNHCRTGNKFTSNLVRSQEFDYEEKELYDKECCIFPDVGTLERYGIPPPSGQYRIMHGACNGIVCVEDDDNGAFAFWNPATRKLRRLPSHPYMKNMYPYMEENNFEVGFGSDPITNALKIVLIDRDCKAGQFLVYKSTEDCWTLFEEGVHFDPDSDSCLMKNSHGRTFSNGICYWIKTNWVKSKVTMLTFDMRNNSLQEMEMPQFECGREEALIDFFDETPVLFIWKISIEPTMLQVWLMKERGCWTKHKTVLRTYSLSNFGVWKGDDQFYAYNEDQDTDKELVVFDKDFGNRRRLGQIGCLTYIYRYKESLISV